MSQENKLYELCLPIPDLPKRNGEDDSFIIAFPICCIGETAALSCAIMQFSSRRLSTASEEKKLNHEIFRPDLFNRPIKKPSSPTPLLCPVSPPPPLVISSLRLPTTHPPSNMLFVNKTRNLNGGELWWWPPPPPPLLPSC